MAKEGGRPLQMKDLPVPMYFRVKQDLLTQIRSLPPHTRLSSENDLARQYGISRGTAKQALAELEQEGALYRVQGKGSFVAEPRILRAFDQLPSFSRDVQRLGRKPGVRVVGLKLIAATATVTEKLGLTAEASVWRAERVVLADDEPFALVTSFVRADLCPELKSADLQRSLYTTLHERYNLGPQWARDTYTVVGANRRSVKLLEVPEGAALIQSERTAYTADMRPIEYVESYIRGDRFTLHVDHLPSSR